MELTGSGEVHNSLGSLSCPANQIACREISTPRQPMIRTITSREVTTNTNQIHITVGTSAGFYQFYYALKNPGNESLRRRRKVANTMNSHQILVNLGLSAKNALHQPQVSVHMLRQPGGPVFTNPVGESRVKNKLVG